ncbi:hypothetical protein B0O99DRAFT_694668 [Bisporella sp. PMI_857]|nr:hypothetical protein B0O99DRAFT_694668 [Bisporella sp. PMI_857]
MNGYNNDQAKQRVDRKKPRERRNKQEKDALIKKVYELGEFDGMDVALIICKHSRYTTYRSRDHKTWPPSMAEIDTKYPLPKKILPEDIEKHLSNREEKENWIPMERMEEL